MDLNVFGLIGTFVTCYCSLCLSTPGKSRDPGVFVPTPPFSKRNVIRADTAHGPSSLTDNWGDHTSHSKPERVGCRHPSERWPRVSPGACLLPTRREGCQAPYGLCAPVQRGVLRG